MQAGGLKAQGITCRRGDRFLFGGLDLRLEPGELSTFEKERAAELLAQKYAHPDWTNRV